MDEIDEQLASNLVIVVDNVGTHNFPSLTRTKGTRDKMPHVAMRNQH
jgi:hypothetical protein